MFLDETTQEVTQGTVRDFRLAIGLGVEGSRKLHRRPHQALEGLPELAGEANVAIGDDAAGNPVEANNFLKEQLSGVGGVGGLEQAIKCAILLNQSMTTRIASNCRHVRDKPRTKSKLTSCQGAEGTGSGRY